MQADLQTVDIQRIRAFWDDQAKRFGAGVAAVSHDPIAKDLEIAALLRHLDPSQDTLEVGTGNGINLRRLLPLFTGALTGVDYSEAMIQAARRAATDDCATSVIRFVHADLLHGLAHVGCFPQVFTCRCLINFPTPDLQRQALLNLAGAVQPGGKLVLIEGFRQGQERINELRGLVGLPPIPYHWHNLYLDEEAMLAHLPEGLEPIATDNFASLYWLISRVFNARMTPPDASPDYLSEINRIAACLPSMGDCGAIKLIALRKSA